MQSFEQIRSHVGSRHALRTNDPYLISFDLALADGRHQGVYLTELEDEEGAKYLRISTPIGPYAGMDGTRCLRFNWEQRTGYLALSDLDDAPVREVVQPATHFLAQPFQTQPVFLLALLEQPQPFAHDLAGVLELA